MSGHVNIHFVCAMENCECGETIVPAQVVTRADGTIMYEYTNRCPKCHHKLTAHRMTDVPVTPRRSR